MALRSRLTAKRVLRPAVDIALRGADRVRRDGHALQDPVRVALQDAPVHERAGVAFVRVADDVSGRAVGLGHGVPLETGRDSRRRRDPADRCGSISSRTSVGRHGREDLAERAVATALDVVLEALGVDTAGVLGRDAHLAREEGRLRHPRRHRAHRGQGVDDAIEAVRPDMREQLAGLGDLDQRSRGTQAEAADPLDRHVRGARFGEPDAEAR